MFFRSIRMDLKSSTVLLLIPLRIYFIIDERFSNLNVSVKLIIHCTKKWSFLLRISSMWPNPQESVDLVTFTGETLNGKHFFCAVMVIYSPYAKVSQLIMFQLDFSLINRLNIPKSFSVILLVLIYLPYAKLKSRNWSCFSWTFLL